MKHTDTKPHALNIQSAGVNHVEARMSQKGEVSLYIYTEKPGELMPLSLLEAEAGLEAQAIVPGEDDIPITFTAKPMSTDPLGTSSRFIGVYARRADQMQVGLSVSLPLDGKTYRVQWTPTNLLMGAMTSSHAEVSMPKAAPNDEAQKLFLVPGGLYTAADITANGSTTAAAKFAGMMAKHDMNPAKGRAVCPITKTAADTRFPWVVGGKTYLFCCPPCVEEFVRKAKESPGKILPPERYVQK